MDIPKKLKTITIHNLQSSLELTVADTVDDNKATRMLNEFEAYGTMHLVDVSNPTHITAIPFGAVTYIAVTETDATQEKSDPYGCVDKGDE